MTLTASNVRVAVTGGIYKAPLGTTMPTDATSPLNGAFKELGYASEDGIVQSINTEITEIRAWQDGATVRKVQTSGDVTYALGFLETNAETLAAYYGSYDAGAVPIKAELGERACWVFHVVDGDTRIRVCIADGQVTERGDISFVSGEALTYPVTITAYPTSIGGEQMQGIQYIDDTSVESIDVTSTLAVADGEIGKVTVTMSPGSVDVTSEATFTSSDPSVATAHVGGFVVGVDAGTATITASYRGKTDTCAVTVTA